MKQIAVISPVPDIIRTLIRNSMLRQAVENHVVDFHLVNLRDFTEGNYRQVDDEPYGGGSGMVMMPGPLFKAIDHSISMMDGADDLRIIYPSPQGERWNHNLALENSHVDNIIIICGHYKGVDERVIEKYVTHEYSLGDFVMTSGEIPAMMIIDSVVRLVPGVLNNYDSALSDSFAADLLDAPYYTRPSSYDGMDVPEVLLSGHHKKIEVWREKERKKRTREKRPDLWKKYLEKNNE